MAGLMSRFWPALWGGWLSVVAVEVTVNKVTGHEAMMGPRQVQFSTRGSTYGRPRWNPRPAPRIRRRPAEQ
jgi:hypothetical protein